MPEYQVTITAQGYTTSRDARVVILNTDDRIKALIVFNRIASTVNGNNGSEDNDCLITGASLHNMTTGNEIRYIDSNGKVYKTEDIN